MGIITALLNFASLILGLLTWILPIINIVRHKKQNSRNWVTLSIISLIACATLIYFQILYNNHLVKIEDFAAIINTIGTLVVFPSLLLVVTIILNMITLFIYSKSTIK